MFLAGGLARLRAIWQTGIPPAFYVLMIPVEILVPVLNWALLNHVR